MKLFKLLLPSREIPLGSIVAKIKGEVEYILKDEIHVYNQEGHPQIIKSDEHSRFLVASNGNINSVGDETILVWNVPEDMLIEYLTEERGK